MKYIPADKLLAEIERRKIILDKYKDSFETAACCKQELEWIKDLISSLQQEQPETPSGEEVMNMCNQILIDLVKEGKTPEEREQREQAHIRFFELYDEYMQEQPEVDLMDTRIQYASVHDGIKSFAETYSFNIDSQLFPQLSKEQQELWRKEIEQAAVSGGDIGITLARDVRYKENQSQPEVDLEKSRNLIRDTLNGVTRLGSLCDDQTIEHAVDNLIDKLGPNARKEG